MQIDRKGLEAARVAVGTIPGAWPHEDQRYDVTIPLFTYPQHERVGVKVKPLEWHGPDYEDEYWAAWDGERYVIHAETGNGRWLGGVGGYFATVEEAKTAAQGDYERRILSALSPPVDHIPDAGNMVPEGYVLVPREPTLAMQNDGWMEVGKQGFRTEDVEVEPIYRAMLAAAPPAQVGR